MSKIHVIIPAAGRGSIYGANLKVSKAFWAANGAITHLCPTESRNRAEAWNRGLHRNIDADVLVFADAGALPPMANVVKMVDRASRKIGLFYPGGAVLGMTPDVTRHIHSLLSGTYAMSETDRDEWLSLPSRDENSLFHMRHKVRSEPVRPVVVASRLTMQRLGGFLETLSGWYSDEALRLASRVLCGVESEEVGGIAYLDPGDLVTSAEEFRAQSRAVHDLARAARAKDSSAVRSLLHHHR